MTTPRDPDPDLPTLAEAVQAAHRLSRALRAGRDGPQVRRALRFATCWGSFPRAYTPEHHRLGAEVLTHTRYALDTYADSGRLPSVFTAACRALLATADAEGRLG
jgi:hypothetical protein